MSFLPPPPRNERRPRVSSSGAVHVLRPRNFGGMLPLGAMGGALAGLAGLVVASVITVALGGEALAASNAFGAMVVRWLQIGQAPAYANFYPDATLGGLALAASLGALIGAPLAAFIARFPEDHPVAWGLVAGLLTWVVARWVILPALDPAALRILPAWAILLGHLAYGLALGAWLAALRPLRSL